MQLQIDLRYNPLQSNNLLQKQTVQKMRAFSFRYPDNHNKISSKNDVILLVSPSGEKCKRIFRVKASRQRILDKYKIKSDISKDLEQWQKAGNSLYRGEPLSFWLVRSTTHRESFPVLRIPMPFPRIFIDNIR